MSVPGNLYTPTIRKTRGGDYLIEQSLRFNDNDTAYLNRTPSTAGNRKTFTFSVWVKRANISLGANANLLSAGADGNNSTRIGFVSTNVLRLLHLDAGATTVNLSTTAVYRDPSAWLHVVVAVDTTQATASDRIKMYVNGVQITDFSTATYPTQNFDFDINSLVAHAIGARSDGNLYFDGLIALPILVDGAALNPTSFGEEDADGYWNPIEFTGATGFSGNAFTGGTASASSGTAANAFDNNDATNWFTSGEGQGASAWLQYDLGAGNTAHIRALSILTANGGGIYMWATFKLQYSDNGSTWTDVSELGADTTLDRSGTLSMYYEFEETGEHRYWRLQGITGANSPGEPTIATLVGHTEFVNGYGTNGFVLNFSDTSNFGDDTSGNGNDYTPNNFTATDQLADTPTDSTANETGNWMTMSPINTNTNVTFSEGNMRLVGSGGDKRTSISSMVLPSTGKFYFEAYWNSYAGDSGIGFMDTNVMNTSTWRTDANGFPGGAQNTDGYAANDGPNYYVDGGGAVSLTSPSATNYQQLAIDMDTGEVWYGINNTWLNSGNPAAGTGEVGTFDAANLANGLFFITSLRLGADVTLNFGQRAFNYTPPTGFTGLSHTANYPDPTIAKPSDYFNTVLYTGNGTAIGSGGQSITGVGFQPDFVWIKERTNTSPPVIVDAVRGVTKFLRTSDTTAEDTNTESLTEFNTDGFTVGNAGAFNQSAEDYVAWCWKANGAAVSNTDGSTTSSVSVNTTSGFSIVSYTGTGVAATIGHGLGVAPKLMIVKNRDATQNWRVYTAELGATKYLNLNTTAAQDTDANQWNNTEPTSSVFSVGTSGPTNGSTNDIIAYCWAEVEGFSKFGSYTGNGSTDGPFVYCGFRPAFVLIKRTNTTGDWTISDNKRDTYNPTDLILKPNTTQVDISGGNELDFNANGFKVRNLGANRNASGGTYIFAAYAEHPFQGDDGYTQGRAR